MMNLGSRVPTTVVYEWKNKFEFDIFNPNHKEAVKKLLNSPDYDI